MGRTWLVVAALLGGCGDDAGSGTRDGGGGGSDSGSGSGSDSGGNGSPLLSGTSCEGAVSYTLSGDEKITILLNSDQTLRAIFLHDGPIFDNEEELAWQTYAQTYDTYFVIGVMESPSLVVQTLANTFDSLFGGRNAGVMGFAEDGTENVQITAVDTSAKTIAVSFTFPVWGSTTAYPPAFDMFVECRDTTPGSVTGSFSGTYETMTL